jgi:hypothetical protein
MYGESFFSLCTGSVLSAALLILVFFAALGMMVMIGGGIAQREEGLSHTHDLCLAERI